MSIHQCPKCQLRYLYRSLLDLHLREDHEEPLTRVPPVDTPVPAPRSDRDKAGRAVATS